MSSKLISKQRLAALSAGVSLMGASMALAAGGSITISSSPALPLSSTGLTQGLIGTIWHVAPTGATSGSGSASYGLPAGNDPTLTDVATMETYINSGSAYNTTTALTYTLPTPSETFLNTADKFNYTSTSGGSFFGGVSTGTFLGADASGAAATDTTPWVNSVVDQMGYIKIASAGTYTFTFKNADDAAAVYVGGTGITPTGNAGSGTQIVAASYDGNVIPTSNYTANVAFGSAGYYPIEIMNYQEGGGAGMNFAVTAPTGGTTPTYWTTTALASSVTPAATQPTPSAAPAPTDEWNFGKSVISGSSVSDIGSAATATSAGTIVGSATSVVGSQLVTTSNNGGNGMTIPGATFASYTGNFTISVTFTRNANDPTANWGSVYSFGTQNNPGAGFVLFQPHRNDGSGFASVSVQPASVGSSQVINGNGQPIPTGSLTQEVFVYNAATNIMSLYYNGVLQQTQEVILPSGTTSFDLASYAKYVGIGGVDPFNDPSMMGSYNDFSTWNSALTSSQVAGLYASTAVPEPGAVALIGIGAVGMLLVKRRRNTVQA